MADNSQIHVALASDDNYFRGLLVTAVSMAERCSASNKLVFHVLDGGICEDNWKLLCSQLETWQAHVDRIHVDQSRFSQFTTWHGNGRMAYARLLLPEILTDVRHVIYCDVDFLWLDDIAVLWSLKDDAVALRYVRLEVRDPICFKSEDQWLSAHGLTMDADSYFCTGLLVMNLEMFRTNKFHEKALAVLRDNGGDAPMVDQTALNVVFSQSREKSEIPAKWQRMTSDKSVFQNGYNAVLHYAGDCPWRPIVSTNHLLTDMHILWYLAYSRIKGIGLLQALCEDNSILMIALGRLLYLSVCHCAFVKKLLRKYLSMREKDASFLDGVFRIPRSVVARERNRH